VSGAVGTPGRNASCGEKCAKVAKELLFAEMAKPTDDPDYVAIANQHKGKLMCDDEADPLYRSLLILDITFSAQVEKVLDGHLH
jgi:hypothetical protein